MELRSGYKQAEVGLIPIEWEVKPLGSIGTVIRGASPRPKGDKRFYGGDIPRLMVEDVTRDKKFITPQIDYLTAEGAKQSRPCKQGTLTVVCSGTPGVVGMPSFLAVDACIHDGMMALVHMTSSVVPDYLFHQLCSYQDALYKTATHGGTFVNLTTAGLRNFQIALPPNEHEQRAIATALSDIDALIAGLEQLIAKKRDLKQAAMQQLLTGQTRLPGFSGVWEVKLLGDVAEVDPDNLSASTDPQYEFRYIALENVDRGTLVGYSEQIFSTAPSRARRKLQAGDILVSTVRPNLQSHLLFSESLGDWVCSTGFSVVRCRFERAIPAYVYAHFFADAVNSQIDALLTGSNYPAINSGDVRALKIAFPSVEEQQAIAIVLSDLDAELAALETRLAKTRALKTGMMQELLTGRTRLL